MHVDLTLDNARVYNVEKVDIVKGEKFALDIPGEQGQTRWFVDNDPVLSLNVSGNSADGEALQVGKSEILIMSVDYVLQKKLFFEVVESVQPPASQIGATAGAPVDK